jgi:hypothetical protein
MKTIATLAALSALLILPGCLSVTPGAVDTTFSPTGSPLKAGLNLRVLDDKVVAAMVVNEGDPSVADYIIQRPNEPSFLYHVESANPGQSFPFEVNRERFYHGTYTMKVFLDKATTPSETQTFQIP